MASHLGALGFPATTREEFEALGVLAANMGEARDADGPPPALYLRWASGGGAELWAQADPATHSIRGLVPYFASGRARLDAVVTSVQDDPRRVHDGRVFMVPEGDERRKSLAAVPVTLPDYRLARPALKAGQPASFSLAAFAHALEPFDSPHELMRAAPSGLAPGLLLAAPQGGLSLGAGVILARETRLNLSSKREFGWCLLEVSGGTVDVVVDPALRKVLPDVGAAVRGVFWLAGRLAGGEPPGAPSER